MRLILSLLILTLCLQSAQSAQDRISVGPYEISFDLGGLSDEYNVTALEPQETESIGGVERTDYSIQIISINKTKARNAHITAENFTPSLMTQLLYSKDMGIATITIKEYKEPRSIATYEVLAAALELLDESSSQEGTFKVANRSIDGTWGAIDSLELVTDPTNPLMIIEYYHVLYSPLVDPSHVVVEISSFYPWDKGTLQLLKTIHIDKN